MSFICTQLDDVQNGSGNYYIAVCNYFTTTIITRTGGDEFRFRHSFIISLEIQERCVTWVLLHNLHQFYYQEETIASHHLTEILLLTVPMQCLNNQLHHHASATRDEERKTVA